MSDESSPITKKQIGDYLIYDLLGSGTFAKCYTGMHIPTNERVAIKVIDKRELYEDELNKNRLLSEIEILKKIRHKNIIKLYEIMETPSSIYLVMEYCNTGELFDYIVSKDVLSEKQACVFFQNIIDALSYLHSLNIAHRDVKPENILLDTTSKTINCKLIDFGLSKEYEKNKLLQTPCGTSSYAPPEMHRNEKYDGILSDVWSSGVLLYSMVCGFLPFNERNEEDNVKNILKGNYSFPEDELSPELIDLIKHLLDTNTKTRYNLQQIKKHPWFNLVPKEEIPGFILGYHRIPIDQKVIKNCEYYGYNKDEVIDSVKKNKYDKNSACYYIIVKKFEMKRIESISDLFSEKYIDYINDEDNLLTEEEINEFNKENVEREKKGKEEMESQQEIEIQEELERQQELEAQQELEKQKDLERQQELKRQRKIEK
jgi:5'-AMP-activated protein kinase catalytic alpha subunit